MRILMPSSQVVVGRPPLQKRAKSDAKPAHRTSDKVHSSQPQTTSTL